MGYGSKRWYNYTTDDGEVFALNLDESNTELINTDADAQTLAAGSVILPATYKRRLVKLLASDQSSKTVVVLTRTRYDAITLGQSFAAPSVGEENAAGTSFVVVQKIPERILNAPRAIDTGKIDGDQP